MNSEPLEKSVIVFENGNDLIREEDIQYKGENGNEDVFEINMNHDKSAVIDEEEQENLEHNKNKTYKTAFSQKTNKTNKSNKNNKTQYSD